jgi:hypothetical protein
MVAEAGVIVITGKGFTVTVMTLESADVTASLTFLL